MRKTKLAPASVARRFLLRVISTQWAIVTTQHNTYTLMQCKLLCNLRTFDLALSNSSWVLFFVFVFVLCGCRQLLFVVTILAFESQVAVKRLLIFVCLWDDKNQIYIYNNDNNNNSNNNWIVKSSLEFAACYAWAAICAVRALIVANARASDAKSVSQTHWSPSGRTTTLDWW